MKAFAPFLFGLAAACVQAQSTPPVAPVAPVGPVAPVAAAAPVPPAEPGRLYAPGPFDRLELAGAARVLLVQGERDQAFIVGDAEVQKSVAVDLADGRLSIRPVSGWKFWNSGRINIQVEMRQPRQITLSGATDLHAPGPIHVDGLKLNISGAGQARLDKLRAQQLAFDISGAGDGQLAGRVDDLVLRISGKGKVIADQLKAQRAQISISGIGNATVWVSDELAANISGIGSVDYFGQPQVQRVVSGLGQVTGRGERK